MNNKIATALLVVVAGLFGYLLALHGAPGGSAEAQEGQGNSLICQVGDRAGGAVPIVLVDTETQRVVVYEYNVGSTYLEMGGVRPFTYDVRSGPFNNRGPTVREVQSRVQAGGPFRR